LVLEHFPFIEKYYSTCRPSSRRTPQPFGGRFSFGALVLAAAAAAPVITLPFSIVTMVVLVALLLADRLTAAHRATRQRPCAIAAPGPQSDPR
jgi:hypothetical protein